MTKSVGCLLLAISYQRVYSISMNMTKYETANSWMSAMHEEGHGVSIVLCQAIEKIMKAQKVTFSEAFKELDDEHLVAFKDGKYELLKTD